MVIILRHLLAILLLPFLAVVVVPAWFLTADHRWDDSSPTG